MQAEQGVFEPLLTDVYRLAVEVCTAIFPGIVALVGTDLIDHAEDDAAALHQCDADGVRGILMDEVGGAVERVDHPDELFAVVACRTFLGDESGFGQQLAQGRYDARLGAFIDIAHVVVGVLALYLAE